MMHTLHKTLFSERWTVFCCDDGDGGHVGGDGGGEGGDGGDEGGGQGFLFAMLMTVMVVM